MHEKGGKFLHFPIENRRKRGKTDLVEVQARALQRRLGVDLVTLHNIRQRVNEAKNIQHKGA